MLNEQTSTSVAASLADRKSHFGVVKLSDLKIDMRFQRAVNLNAVRKIKQEFHPAGVGCFLIAKINGDDTYCIVDGQTRYRAMMEAQTAGETSVQAEIFEGLAVAEAAMLFRLRNNQKPIPPKERDRVSTIEGDPVMIEVVRQASAAGYIVFADDPELITMPHLNEAKMIVRWGIEKSFPDLLARALLIQAHAFESPEGSLLGTIQPKLLAATAELIVHNEHLNDDELARVMNEAGFGALQAQIARKADQEGTRIKSAAKSVLTERYNKGKRGDDRITR